MSLAQRISDLASRIADEINLIKGTYVSQNDLDPLTSDLITQYMGGTQTGLGSEMVALIGESTRGTTQEGWFKERVRVATTANITLSGTQTIDGVAVISGNRVLVKNQTTASQNGIYVVNGGSWTRYTYSDTALKLSGAMVAVETGSLNGGSTYKTYFKSTDTVGSTSMVWSKVTTELDAVLDAQLPERIRITRSNLITDLNNATDTGWYVTGNNPTNAPAAGAYSWGVTMENYFTGYAIQTAQMLVYNTGANQFRYRRTYNNAVWSAWYQIEDSLYAIQSSFAPLYHTLENHPSDWTKRAVRAVATTNIASLSGTMTIDGVSLVAGNRVLLTAQTTASANGIYVVAAGAWARSTDADTAAEIAGAVVSVAEGTTGGGLVFRNGFKATDTLGTTAMPWQVLLTTTYGSGLPVAVGGTGATDAYGARWNTGALGSASSLLPALTAGTWTVVPGLNALMNRNGFQISFREVSTGERVELGWRVNTSTNDLEVRADVAVTVDTIRAIVLGGGL